MAKEKNQWLTCLWDVVKTSLACFGVLLVFSIILAAALMEFESRLVRDCIMYVLTMACYAVLFYRFHMYPRISTYMEHPMQFDLKKEFGAFLRADGRIILAIYGVAAVAIEISCFIFPSPTPNPIATACLFALGPFGGLIPVPVLRSVICFVYAAVVLCVLTLLRSRKIYKNDLAANARRRER